MFTAETLLNDFSEVALQFLPAASLAKKLSKNTLQ
jgi:hypothetical protein